MKVVIPVAGVGTRLRPHTHTQPKSLVPVAGKPILSHIVDLLTSVGIDDFIFVTGYLGKKVESFVRSNYEGKINFTCVEQEPREGLAHAVWTAADNFVDDPEVLIMLGDTILSGSIEPIITSPYSILGVKRVDVPGNFGVAELNDDGFVKRLVEKPKIPKSNLALAGIYKIKNPEEMVISIENLMANEMKTLGEYQLTDALQDMVSRGENMRVHMLDTWYDCGKRETLLDTNATLLNRPEFKNPDQDQHPSTILIPPVSIGQGCEIEHSIIGPNVAIGDHTTIRHSILRNSIVGTYSELDSSILNHSVIGNDSSLKGFSQTLNIGDNTEINFSNE